jgi:hypothetical protein
VWQPELQYRLLAMLQSAKYGEPNLAENVKCASSSEAAVNRCGGRLTASSFALSPYYDR